MQPTERDLERLARKYRTLGELRRARERGEAIPERKVFRDLAAEFPGALNELDTLPIETIEQRLAELTGAAAGGTMEPWMAWIHSYHALFRAALYIKVRVQRGRAIDDDRAAALAEAAAAHASKSASLPLFAQVIDGGFVRSVATPQGGRLNPVVFERLSAVFGVPASQIQRALFPGLRVRRG